MKKLLKLIQNPSFLFGVLLLFLIPELKAQRDPYLRPFANNSIWNMAIHNNAIYVDAKINAPTAWGVTADPEIIILSPTSPNVGIFTSGWPGSTRCDKGAFITNAPIPDGWINGIPEGTPNNSTAILAPDGQTVINLQCLHRCATSGPASSLIQYPSENLYGAGIQGGHGGSGMGALGGSIRVGELTPNYTEAQIKADPNIFIKHVIKMNVNTLLYVSNTNGGYRWPAVKADGAYNSPGACDYYGGTVPQFKMGSLLAIPKNVNIETMGLQTGPGIMMARTLQKYGAYLVDATCWDVVAFEVQTGPLGDVESQFATKYGYSFSPQSTSGAWAQDISKIVQELFVVDNNNASNIGGGPTTDLVNRLAPAICDIGTPGSGIYDCGTVVNVPVTGVTISPATANITAGSTITLTATIAPSNATNKSVTWISSNTAVAIVSSAGVVTGVAGGTATLTVTTSNGSKTATCVVTVNSSGSGNYKIMTLGDSKVEGGGGIGGHHSWRGYLRAKLIANGNTINYVGPRSNTALGDGSPVDNDHTGFGGYTIGPDTQKFCTTCETTGIFENIQSYFVAQNPDIVLLSVGVNDFFNGPSHPANYTNTAPQRYQDLVNKILQLKPSVTLVLGSIEPVKWDIGFGGNPNDNDLGALNAKIKQIADASATDKIFFADIRNQFLPTWSASDYFDDIHLSQQGADKAATIWYNTLLPILQSSSSIAVTGVTLSPTSSNIVVGATTPLTFTVTPASATNKNVTWASNNTAIATVSSTGIVTGVAPGTATITVTTTDGNKTATCTVTVTAGSTNTYEAENGTYGGGGQTQTASNASNGNVIGNLNAQASYTQVSNVNGGSGGTANLVIRYANGFSTTSTMGLYVNGTFVQNVSFPVTGGWNTFSEVTVSINLLSGTANTIKLQIGSGNAAADIDKYTITPGSSVLVTAIALAPTSVSVVVGATTTLSATVAPANATNKNVSWASSNTFVATVSTTGVVNGVAVGTANITVTTQDGNKTATCTVTVTSANVAVTGVSVSPTTATLPVGATSQLTATVAPANATNKNVSWSSSNTAVATVNATGIVSGVAPGTATITVTTTNGNKAATCAVTVTATQNTTNLLGINPSFEAQTGVSYANGVYNGITGWTLNNTAYNSISVSAGNAQQGNNKLSLVYGGKAATLPANYASITAGQTYTLSMAISKVSNTNTAVQSPIFFRIDWYNSSNVLISSTSSGNILGGATSPWTIFSVTGNAPANATKASCYVELVNTSYPNNDVASFNIDNVKLNAGSTVARIASEQSNNDESGVSLNVYPMPTNGDFTVEINGFSKPDLMIVDILGKIVFTKKEINDAKIKVTNTFRKGTYIVLVQDEFNKQSKKIIIE